MTLRRWGALAGLLVVACGLTGCESDPPVDRAEATPAATPAATATPAPTPSPPTQTSETDELLSSLFEGVRGYTFSEASSALSRRLTPLFRRHAPAPIADLTVKRVHKGGRLIPAMVLVALFDVRQKEFSDFFSELALDISRDFDDVEPALDGLGAHFLSDDQDAVAYAGPHGELVYVLSPQPGLAVPLAEALVAAERR